jgi:hypothetical protein
MSDQERPTGADVDDNQGEQEGGAAESSSTGSPSLHIDEHASPSMS